MECGARALTQTPALDPVGETDDEAVAVRHPHSQQRGRVQRGVIVDELVERKHVSSMPAYSILSPIAFTTLAYFSVSLLRYAPACSGVDPAGTTPIPA